MLIILLSGVSAPGLRVLRKLTLGRDNPSVSDICLLVLIPVKYLLFTKFVFHSARSPRNGRLRWEEKWYASY
jgi:hypothetical protein